MTKVLERLLIVLLHQSLSSKFTSLCCVNPWIFFNKEIGLFSHNNIKYCWEDHCRIFRKPRYFNFFTHTLCTWDLVIPVFVEKLNLAIANGWEASKNNGNIYNYAFPSNYANYFFKLPSISHFIFGLCIPTK